MKISGFDHIVLCVRDIPSSVDFYQRVLGMQVREETPGKFSLHFGSSKINLQDAADPPSLAKNTLPGSGNFCLFTDTDIIEVADHLTANDVDIILGPTEKIGAIGKLMSVYFRDPDGNLVEVSNRLP